MGRGRRRGKGGCACVAARSPAAYASFNKNLEGTVRGVVWLLAFCFAATAAQADTYPNKPIRMIVPFPAGSATDGQARLIGAHFQKLFGQGFIVENMAGATGSIAARSVAKAPPDGYTLLLSSVSTHSANVYLYNNLGYDPIADFTPVALIARAPSAMVVRAETPYRTLQDFVSFAKDNPDKLNFAYGNMGSLAGGAMLNAAAGIKTHGVSYRGTPQATTDLLGGQIDFVVMDMSQDDPSRAARRRASLSDIFVATMATIARQVLPQTEISRRRQPEITPRMSKV